MHVNSLKRYADLSRIIKSADYRFSCGFYNIGGFIYDEGGIASKLHSIFFKAAFSHYFPADLRTSGKTYHADFIVSYDSFSGVFIAVKQVQRMFRQSGFQHCLNQKICGNRTVYRRLKYDAVSGGYSWSDFMRRKINRKIKRRNSAYNADRNP